MPDRSSLFLKVACAVLVVALIASYLFLRDYPILIFVIAAAFVALPVGWKRHHGMRVDIPTVVFNVLFLIMFLSEVLGVTDIHERLPWWAKWAWVSVLAIGNLILRWRSDWTAFRREQRLRDALQAIAEFQQPGAGGEQSEAFAAFARQRARDALNG
jgi:hypothetical protein